MRTEPKRDYYSRHGRWRDAPLAFVEASVNATLLGLGAGMAVGFLILAAASLIVRLQT